MLGLPEASFGLVACGMAALGLLTPALASWMQKHLSSGQNFLLLAAAVLVGWIGVAVVRTPWGIAPSLLLASCIGITGFLVSTGLNAAAHSEIRATVLSFRGLVFNLGYGALSAVFAWMQAALRGGTGDEMVALAAVLPWLPACFVCAVLVFCALIAVTRR